MAEATEAVGMTFRDGATPKFTNCMFEVHAGNKVKESGAKPKRRRPVNCQTTLSNDFKERAKVSEEKRECSLFNGVWMHVENAKILSVFCKEETALMNKGTYLGNEYKRILPLPEELLVPTSCTVEAGFDCIEPRELKIDGSPTNKLKIKSPPLRKNSYQLYFQPIPHPDKLDHAGSYEVSYYARLYDSKYQLISEGIDAPLDLCWPLHSQHKMPTGEREQASTSGTQNINIDKVYASGDAHIGGQGQHIDHRQKGREDTPAAGAASADQLEGILQKMEYLEHIYRTMEQYCRRSSSLTQEIGPNGGSIELDGCGVHPPPGTIKKNMEIEVSVGVNPCPSPSSGTQITRMLKRKPSNMDSPIPVKLTSWLVPKPKKKLPVMIKSKTGDTDWKVIHKRKLNDGNIIEYSASHFCWHVAVVSEDDEKNGEYHLLNDVWMHVSTGRILSVFWKDEIALQNASKALESDHKRILPIPGEIIVSVGDTLIVDIQCNSPPGVRMMNVEGSDARVEITHERMKKNFFTLLFWPNPHPEKIQSAEPYEVLYSADTLDAEGQPADGGFSAPLDYEWPPKPIEGKDGKSQVHRLWNYAWVNKYESIALLFCENKETRKLKTKMSSPRFGKMILDAPQPVVVCEGDIVTVKLYHGKSMERRRLEHVEVMEEKTLFWKPFFLESHMRPSKSLHLCYAVEILRSKTGLTEEAFSVPFSWEPPLEPSSGRDILHYVSPMVLSSPPKERVDEPVSSIVLSPPGEGVQEPETKNVTAPDERQNAETSLTKKSPIKTQELKRGSDRSLTELQFKGESSQDHSHPSDESASILTEEYSTDTLRQAADSLSSGKTYESLWTVHSTKNTDRDKRPSTFSSTTKAAAEIMQIEMLPVPAVTREKTKLYPHEGESSQDYPLPSVDSASILTEETSTETLRQAADSLSIEKYNESSGIVQSTKITDREIIVAQVDKTSEKSEVPFDDMDPTTSKIRRRFVSSPMVGLPVTAVPGVGPVYAERFAQAGITRAEQLFGHYLNRNEMQFRQYLVNTAQMKERNQRWVYDALYEWKEGYKPCEPTPPPKLLNPELPNPLQIPSKSLPNPCPKYFAPFTK